VAWPPDKRKNLSEIMDHFNSIELFERVKFKHPKGDATVPSELMLWDSLVPPPLTITLATRVLKQYISEDEANKFIEKYETTFSWEEITKAIGEKIEFDPCLEKAYAFFLLQTYRVHLSDSDFRSSKEVFRQRSNLVVRWLSNQPEDPTFLALCEKVEKTGMPHKTVRYFQFLVGYCWNMFPRPLQHIKNVDKEYLVRELIERKIIELENDPDKENSLDDVPDSSKKIVPYLKSIEEHQRRLCIRFEEYIPSQLLFDTIGHFFTFEERSGKKDFSDFYRSRFDAHYNEITRQKARSRKKTSSIILPLTETFLHQCQFCFAYRQREHQNIPPWHCGEPDCKRAYDAWSKHLNRKGVGLETLRESGF
jgi:hypothetical protein